jgi:hypothetical protein
VSPFNETGPRVVVGTLYSTPRAVRRDGDHTHHADVGNRYRPPRPLHQTPLRPSEGLPVASPQVLKPCQADRRAAQTALRGPTPGDADGESTNMGPRLWETPLVEGGRY